MTEPETCSSEVDAFSEPDKSASETSSHRKQSDNSVVVAKSDIINKELVNKLVEKRVREHIERRFSHSESEKVNGNINLTKNKLNRFFCFI
jgi:hypothetical protein